MDFKYFENHFREYRHWCLDDDKEGRYFILTRPLRFQDLDENRVVKFTSFREMWDFVFDGVRTIGDALKGLESFELALDGGRGAGSGTGGGTAGGVPR